MTENIIELSFSNIPEDKYNLYIDMLFDGQEGNFSMVDLVRPNEDTDYLILSDSTIIQVLNSLQYCHFNMKNTKNGKNIKLVFNENITSIAKEVVSFVKAQLLAEK